MAHGSWVVKMVASESRRAPELAGGGLEGQQHGVGGGIVAEAVRSWSRAIMASSMTATAPIGSSPSSAPRFASAIASAMKSS